jgi:hypothetical protein
MMQRPALAGTKAANDNMILLHRAAARSAQDLLRMPIIPRRDGNPLPPPQPFRIGIAREDGRFRPYVFAGLCRKRPYARSLLIAGFSGVVLVTLSGAFLVGLAAVGLLAAVIGGFDLLRRQIWRRARPPLVLDQQVAGYPGRP